MNETIDTPGTPALEATGITKTFFTTDPPAQVLNGIDLAVGVGEFVAIMGASGSGKSTLLYAISGMDRPTEGTVLIDGVELTSLSDVEMAKVRLHTMGFIFQQAHLLANLNIGDNVLLPALKADPDNAEAAHKRVRGLLERFAIDHVAHHATTEVSGGQLQRAAICRAMAAEPSIIFADEPTGALNSAMSAEVMDSLTELNRDGTSLVMVTHSGACASRADRVIYLRDGLVVDEIALGKWTPEAAQDRELTISSWLAGQGF
ncbi:ABC transporter ATP-binding protein [Nocardioides sp. GXZ039]|uniref:ABC transporter ATP-binding protein n=1 Tax=Nocardioides sp. GXZ039 TaxID=3136018 RepID=UPI0030F3A2F5